MMALVKLHTASFSTIAKKLSIAEWLRRSRSWKRLNSGTVSTEPGAARVERKKGKH